MFRRSEDDRSDRNDRNQPIKPREVGMSNTGSGGAGEVTVVGQGARLDGTLISAGSLRIDGQIKGKITAEGDVSLTAQSKVEADIEATNVSVAGAFKGNILAKERAELAKGGRVDGNVTSRTLVVAEGAMFSGQSIMGETAARSAQSAGGATVSVDSAEPEKART
jgi:cytoskeletal protein CcmA (bactofilin family)